MRVLILGGTGEARALAHALGDAGMDFMSSLAGRVSRPALPVGPVRIGGFGGPEGLATFLTDERIDAVVDATHPFAETISRNAALATAARQVPLLVLRRPAWTQSPDDRWTRVADIVEAAATIENHPVRTVFLTTGRRDLAAFSSNETQAFVVRTVDPPDGPTPRRMTLLLDRGPYTVEGERALMRQHDVGLLVTKDSGGAMTVAKLTAARELGIPVIVVNRPAVRDGVAVADTIAAAETWISRLRGTGAA